MPLSAEEIAASKKAYYEIRTYESTHTTTTLFMGFFLFFVLLFGIFFACGLTAIDHDKTYKGWAAFALFLSGFWRTFIFFGPMLSLIVIYRRLKPRYAENLRFVTELEKKHAEELPYGLEYEIDQQVPLLGAWTRRPEKRAILWRLDAFLSRKQVSA